MISDSADNFAHLVAFFSMGRTELARQTLAWHRHRSHPPRRPRARLPTWGWGAFADKCLLDAVLWKTEKKSDNAAKGFGFFLFFPFISFLHDSGKGKGSATAPVSREAQAAPAAVAAQFTPHWS